MPPTVVAFITYYDTQLQVNPVLCCSARSPPRNVFLRRRLPPRPAAVVLSRLLPFFPVRSSARSSSLSLLSLFSLSLSSPETSFRGQAQLDTGAQHRRGKVRGGAPSTTCGTENLRLAPAEPRAGSPSLLLDRGGPVAGAQLEQLLHSLLRQAHLPGTPFGSATATAAAKPKTVSKGEATSIP